MVTSVCSLPAIENALDFHLKKEHISYKLENMVSLGGNKEDKGVFASCMLCMQWCHLVLCAVVKSMCIQSKFHSSTV